MRLVDADNARECFGGDGVTGAVMQRMFDSLPTIDAVPVVRCRECDNHSEVDGQHYCKFWRMYCPDDSEFFCKAGQRKEDNLDEAIEKYLKIIDSIHDGEGGQHE